jgi:DNA-binding beta-propeller fold protein YncE
MARLYVQHTYGHDVAVYDEANAYAEIGRIALGANWRPDSVVLSKDEQLLYTNWSDVTWVRAEHRGAAKSLFTAHKADSLEEVWRLELDGGVQHFAADPARRVIYNAVFERPRVIAVDVENRTANYIQIPVIGGHKVRVSADGEKCYVGSLTASEFIEIDCKTARFTRRHPFPSYVRPFVLTPDGRTAYIQVSHCHGFYDFDLAEWRVRKIVALPQLPPETPVEHEWPFTVDHGIEISKDGRWLCCLATTGDYMAVYALPSLELAHIVRLGVEPSYLTFSPKGDKLYVTNRVKGGVIVLSVPDFKQVAQIPETGKRPQRICVSA